MLNDGPMNQQVGDPNGLGAIEDRPRPRSLHKASPAAPALDPAPIGSMGQTGLAQEDENLAQNHEVHQKGSDNDFRVLSRFELLLPPLSLQENDALEESIKADGCREPLTVWKRTQEEGGNVLLDGHNRYRICTANDVTFRVDYKSFSNEADARKWVFENALGRRSLTPMGLSYSRGRLCLALRSSSQRAPGKIYQVAWEALAKRFGVTEKTVRNDVELAISLDRLAKLLGERAKNEILSGKLKLARKQISALVRVAEDEVSPGLENLATSKLPSNDEDNPPD